MAVKRRKESQNSKKKEDLIKELVDKPYGEEKKKGHGSKTTYFGIHMREKSYPLLASLIIMKYSEIKKSKQVF